MMQQPFIALDHLIREYQLATYYNRQCSKRRVVRVAVPRSFNVRFERLAA